MKKIVALILTLLLFAPSQAVACSGGAVIDDFDYRDGVVFAVGEDKPFTGTYLVNYPTGKPYMEIDYFNGLKDGDAIWWYENGYRHLQEKYVDGIRDGHSTKWYDNGQELLTIYWNDGRANSARQWDLNGNEVIKKTNTKEIETSKLLMAAMVIFIVYFLSTVLKFQSLQTISFFTIMGLISGFILLALPWDIAEYSTYSFKEWKSNSWWLIGLPGIVFGSVLYAAIRYYRIITDNHWKNFLILIIASIVGWVVANEVFFAVGNFIGANIALGLAGIFNALFIAIALLWVCKLNSHRLLFVSIIGVFGLISGGVIVYASDVNWVLQVWHPIVFMGIAFCLKITQTIKT